MAVYVAEPIDIADLQTLFEANWDTKSGGEIPKPKFTTVDAPRQDPSLQWGPDGIRCFVDIHYSEVTDQQDGHAYAYAKVRVMVTLEIWTRREVASAGGINRQHLHDVKQELRRIIYSNKHSLANWQIMKYMGFEEVFEESISVRFRGRIRVSLESDGIRLPTELVDEDLFNRADAAIGAEWTVDSGTWEVVSNKAALQSATADAIMRFTPAGAFRPNHRVSVDITTSLAMDAGLIFRYQDASNFWRIQLIDVAGVHFIRLSQTVAAADVQVAEQRGSATSYFNWADGAVVQVDIDLYNDGLNVLFNGLSVFCRIDTFLQTATLYGLFANSDQLTRFDNFHIFESGGDGR